MKHVDNDVLLPTTVFGTRTFANVVDMFTKLESVYVNGIVATCAYPKLELAMRLHPAYSEVFEQRTWPIPYVCKETLQ